jgi:hypothetical protein
MAASHSVQYFERCASDTDWGSHASSLGSDESSSVVEKTIASDDAMECMTERKGRLSSRGTRNSSSLSSMSC